ncbi:MAG: response regulator transcription factor [Pyrinomonadaceae bacterium]
MPKSNRTRALPLDSLLGLRNHHGAPSKAAPRIGSSQATSFLRRYGLAILVLAIILGIQNLLRWFSININFTVPVIVGLVIVAWFAGRRPGLLLAILLAGISVYDNPLPANTTIQSIISASSVLALLVFVVLVISERKAVKTEVRASDEREMSEAKNHGVEALESFQKNSDRIDLVITDVVMPRMGGAELAEKLTAICPRTRILFASAYSDDAIVRHGMQPTNLNYVQKPFSIDGVARKVRDLLDAGGRE